METEVLVLLDVIFVNRGSFNNCPYKTITAGVNYWGSSFNERQNRFNRLHPVINKQRDLLVCK